MREQLYTGTIAGESIRKWMQYGDLCIYPFRDNQLKGCGYNLTATDFVFSTQKGVLQQVEIRNNTRYISVAPYDTVLICTREYIRCPDIMMGTIHSRVVIVSEGFGHISTTVDPKWEGPMLIAINNPSKKKKKLNLDQPIATLVFHTLSEKNVKNHDNPPFRLDILEYYLQKNHGWKQILFHSRAVKRFQHLIELAKESVDIQRIKKTDFQELYIIEDILSKMAHGDVHGWEAALEQIGKGSLKFRFFSATFKTAISSLQEAVNAKQWEIVLERSKQAFSLCEQEYIGFYWEQKSQILKQEIYKNSKDLAFINIVASNLLAKIAFSLFLTGVAVFLILYYYRANENFCYIENLISILIPFVTILGFIWK